MPTVETVRDMPSRPQAPIDETVKIPDAVKRAGRRADAHYQAPDAPETPLVAGAPADGAPPASPTEPPAEPVPPVEPPAPPAPAAPPASPEPEPGTPVSPAQWEHRYHSMKGRHDAAQQTIGSMQEQMQQLGDELMRTQRLLQRGPVEAQPPAATAVKRITPEDEQNYGPELIDLAKRAAQEAVGPEVDALKKRNATLEQTVAETGQLRVVTALDRAVPTWRQINEDPKFIRWLSLRDIYSGGIRHQLLNAAFRAANAPRVVAFFEGFVKDGATTGSLEPAPHQQQPLPPAPREPAVPLVTLAAPGRARPASGDSTVPADKPIFTRTQISTFYTDVRRGAYTGREVEKSRLENEIFAAQKDGRVRG